MWEERRSQERRAGPVPPTPASSAKDSGCRPTSTLTTQLAGRQLVVPVDSDYAKPGARGFLENYPVKPQLHFVHGFAYFMGEHGTERYADVTASPSLQSTILDRWLLLQLSARNCIHSILTLT